MTAQEYYTDKYKLDIGLLPNNISNAITTNWIEHIDTPYEAILGHFKKYNIATIDINQRSLKNGNEIESEEIQSQAEVIDISEPIGRNYPIKFDVNISDPYTYLNTNVLVNKMGIKNFEKLKNLERKICEENVSIVKEVKFSAVGFKKLHKEIFGNLYEWAGKTRNVNFSIGNVCFAPMKFLEQSLNDYFAIIADDMAHKNEINQEMWVKKAANHFGELLFIHPFRDGNGRTTRKFIDFFLKEKGIKLEWFRLNREKYFAASEIAINKGDNKDFEVLFLSILKI